MYVKNDTIFSCELKDNKELIQHVKKHWGVNYEFGYKLILDKILIKIINKDTKLIFIDNWNDDTSVKLIFNIIDVEINNIYTNYILTCKIEHRVIENNDFWSLVYKNLI